MDESTNKLKFLWAADVNIDINRVSGDMGISYENPEEDFDFVEPFSCWKTKAKI